MSSNKVEMSLDDIIKENKNKDKGAKKGNSRDAKGSSGILRRGKKISKQPQKGRVQKGDALNAQRIVSKRPVRTPNPTSSTVATKRLVQKLVKKALAQSSVQSQAVSRRTAIQRPKFRGGKVIRKTVVVNRLKLNPRSRIISRRPRGNAIVQKVVTVRGRGQPRFVPNVGNAALVRRVNYAPVAARPVMIQTVPRVVVQQQRQRQLPVYQPRKIMQGRPSVRDHISLLRTSGGRRQAAPQVVYVTQPQRQQRSPRQRNFRQQQQQVINYQPQQRSQLRRNNFSNQRPVHFKSEPFFEPPNFLQRVPVQNVPQNARSVRRY